MDIPLNYTLEVVYRNCKRVKPKSSNVYNFECPVCNEGKSSGKKRRGFFFVSENYFHCQNCQRSWSVSDWIMEVEGITFKQLLKEASEHDNTFSEIINKQTSSVVKAKQYSLPYDSINLNDPLQLQYYKDNKEIQFCLKYIKERRLNTAINRPKNFYISLSDRIYRNRLCIPFYDINGKIIYYQARALHEKDSEVAKYLSKQGEKSLYGINNITSSIEYIFIFEGPIDSMFCQNGTAACGLSLTEKQKDQLDKYRLYEKIWVLDNQLDNLEVCEKYNEIIDRGERIFFWPEEFKEYKDVNEICVATGKDYIPYKLFVKYSLNGMAAKLKLAELCKTKG
ncbi:MAG: hypothetical protein PHS54_00265 [Clostridia bacterium]|nr:hypothetical protein [Clostridia bacterium]